MVHVKQKLLHIRSDRLTTCLEHDFCRPTSASSQQLELLAVCISRPLNRPDGISRHRIKSSAKLPCVETRCGSTYISVRTCIRRRDLSKATIHLSSRPMHHAPQRNLLEPHPHLHHSASDTREHHKHIVIGELPRHASLMRTPPQ
jgi:hypothetical protein